MRPLFDMLHGKNLVTQSVLSHKVFSHTIAAIQKALFNNVQVLRHCLNPIVFLQPTTKCAGAMDLDSTWGKQATETTMSSMLELKSEPCSNKRKPAAKLPCYWLEQHLTVWTCSSKQVCFVYF